MGFGEQTRPRVTILECQHEGCGHKVLGVAGMMSPRFCPTHATPLAPRIYERVEVPAPR